MPLLDRNDKTFSDSVQRGVLHTKSGDLKSLLAAVKAVQKDGGNGAKLQKLHRRLLRWQRNHPKEFAARGARYDELLGEVQRRARALGVGAATGAVAFVNRARAQLDAFGEYACGDAYYGTPYDRTTREYDYSRGFARCINRRNRPTVEARHRTLQGTTRGAATPIDTIIIPGEWNARQYREIYDRVHRDQAGICTTFAKAAAHVLTTGQDDGPRVEIVSFSNHVYVLVNRQGDIEEGRIPNDWIQERDVIIVDPWAAAMAHACTYLGLAGFPYGGMVRDLRLVASWPLDDAENEDLEG